MRPIALCQSVVHYAHQCAALLAPPCAPSSSRRFLTILSIALGAVATMAACTSATSVCIDCIDTSQFAVEIFPSHKDVAAFTPVEYANLSISSAGNIDVNVQASVLLSGRVFVHKPTGDVPVEGTVTATRPSRIPGRPDRIYQTKIDAEQGTYLLVLPPTQDNETYSLRFAGLTPDQFPPQYFPQAVKRDTRFDLAIDDPDSLPLVYGQVQDDHGVALFGAKVYIKSVPSGAILSTVNYTTAGGRYQLRIPRRIFTDVNIIVEPVAIGSFAPIYETPLKADLSGSEQGVYVPLQTPAEPVATKVTFRVMGQNGAGAENVQCNFRTTFTFANSNATASYFAQAITNTSGAAEISLIAFDNVMTQNYTVVLTPPPESGLQQAVLENTSFTPSAVPVSFTLLPQRKFTGTLTDESGQPLRGVAVRPEQIASSLAMRELPSTTLSRLRDGATDNMGRFSLLLEDGLYRIALVAPATSPLPRKILETTIDRDFDVGTLMLPTGNQIRTQLIGPSGVPVSQATISLFRVKKIDACFAINQCLPNAELIAEGTSNDRGYSDFRLPLPDSD